MMSQIAEGFDDVEVFTKQLNRKDMDLLNDETVNQTLSFIKDNHGVSVHGSLPCIPMNHLASDVLAHTRPRV